MSNYRILTINPGSTSTKVALFEGEKTVFSSNVPHDAETLKKFPALADQLEFRKEAILKEIEKAGEDVTKLDACVGRGGNLFAIEGGTYEVDDLVLDHSIHCANGVSHPAGLGPSLAHEFAEKAGAKAYVVNPPDVDELQDLARLTGIKGVYRVIHLHALNLKETAIRHAASMGKKYEECNFIVCHIGGGISVSAHRKGEMIDGFDIVDGEGPMAPTRCGQIPGAAFLKLLEEKSPAEMKQLMNKTGGFVSHLGISDAVELTNRAADGDKYAELVWNTMIYQIIKCIGSMATVLHGECDGILLGGGMVHSKDLVNQITEACSFIAPITAYPGEFEMEAMAAGATRVMDGVEKAKKYSGVGRFQGFDFIK